MFGGGKCRVFRSKITFPWGAPYSGPAANQGDTHTPKRGATFLVTVQASLVAREDVSHSPRWSCAAGTGCRVAAGFAVAERAAQEPIFWQKNRGLRGSKGLSRNDFENDSFHFDLIAYKMVGISTFWVVFGPNRWQMDQIPFSSQNWTCVWQFCPFVALTR